MLGAVSALAQQSFNTLAVVSYEVSVRNITNGNIIVTEQAPVRVVRTLEGNYVPVATNQIVLQPLLSAQPTAAVSPKAATVNTNSPQWRRQHKLPPLGK